MRIAVLMLNLGGPKSLPEVRPFLKNLFSDREIIRFPGGALGQRLFAAWIAARKAPESASNYAMIGGGTPLLRWTREQGEGMRALVECELGVEILPLPCMRYWHPMAEEALESAVRWGAEHIVAFTQYPHYSTTTTGSSLRELHRVAEQRGLATPLSTIESFWDDRGYVEAVAECVREGVAELPPERRAAAKVLYSAHSLPMKFVAAGDPYPEQIERCVGLVHEAAGVGLPFEVAWQSKVGPITWLPPSTVDRIRALPREGVRDVVVVPISFVNDHIETLHELDIALRQDAERAGFSTFVRAPGLNVRPAFLRALADVLVRHLQEIGVIRREQEEALS